MNRENNATVQDDLEILDEALNALRVNTGIKAEKGKLEIQLVGKPIDAVVKIETTTGTFDYLVEIKPTLDEARIAKLAHQFEDTPGRWLVVTRYAPMHIAKKMKQLNIQFIDTVGNAYLAHPPLFVFLYGNRQAKEFRNKTKGTTLRTAAVKVVYALLCKKELQNATYREITNQAGVALGTVVSTFKDLTHQGFLLDLGTRGRRLQRKRELLDKWVIAYAENTRPKTLIGTYAARKNDFWNDQDPMRFHAEWGGEVAANKLTNYLKPEIVTIYGRKPVNELLLGFKLQKQAGGKVEVRERFWNFETQEARKGIVHPILIYADLMATADPRNVETAKMIFEEYIERHLDEN